MIPDLQDIGAIRKVLPLGRYLATMEELEERYVPADDSNRHAIWESFQEVVDVVRQTFGKLAGVWIGGSFITSEKAPNDIDVIFLVDEDTYRAAKSSKEGRFVTQVLLRRNPHIKQLDEHVDAYLLPVFRTQFGYNYDYMVTRGYWDQFWSKARFPEEDGRWQYPAAGYVEVIIDGYEA